MKRRLFVVQAEDGIRDRTVTGVQTCALPIFGQIAQLHVAESGKNPRAFGRALDGQFHQLVAEFARHMSAFARRAEHENRSEERRVGRGRRSSGWPGRLTLYFAEASDSVRSQR